MDHLKYKTISNTFYVQNTAQVCDKNFKPPPHVLWETERSRGVWAVGNLEFIVTNVSAVNPGLNKIWMLGLLGQAEVTPLDANNPDETSSMKKQKQ